MGVFVWTSEELVRIYVALLIINSKVPDLKHSAVVCRNHQFTFCISKTKCYFLKEITFTIDSDYLLCIVTSSVITVPSL